MNRPVINKTIQSIINTPPKKITELNNFTSEFYQAYKELMSIFLKTIFFNLRLFTHRRHRLIDLHIMTHENNDVNSEFTL
jgi:hypothetical protein